MSALARDPWRARWGDRWRRIVGTPIEHDLTAYRAILAAIRAGAATLGDWSLADLGNEARALASRARAGAPEAELLPAMFALVAVAAERTVGLAPYDEQLIGGIALSQGKVIEMQTGEGKTLAAVAPVALAALAGRGAHVLTFNDYLAARDAAWMGPIYRALGLEVAHVTAAMTPAQRRAAYAADVTYVTAREAGFDLLRDNIALEAGDVVHRPLAFALFDEADSLLVDEARVPLVIATHAARPDLGADRLAALVRPLVRGADFEIHTQGRNIALTDRGAAWLEAVLGCGSLYDAGNQRLLADATSALHAHHLLVRDVDYIVREGRVELVDDFTGRVAERRQWPEGLQAAVEAKEGLGLKSDGRVLGSITMQHFAGNYPRLCGMTGTAREAATDLAGFYGLGVVVIPTHAPCRRDDAPDRVFTHAAAKQAALVAEITRVHATGRPILVGTASVRESEELHAALAAAGLPARVLNAKNDAAEAAVIAAAGARGAITISTNMAGRGTDIRLGGADGADHATVVALGGLYVIGTNRHASRRVDLQLRGRSGRQGDPGSTRFYVSLEDPLLVTYGVADLLRRRPAPRDQAIEDRAPGRAIAQAQRIIEGASFDIRKRLWKYSGLLEEQRRVLAAWRHAVRAEGDALGLLEDRCPDRWRDLVARFGAGEAARLEQRLTLLATDHAWCEHLALVARIRDGIHVVGLAGKDPLTEYRREVGAAFAGLRDEIDADVVARFSTLSLTGERIDWRDPSLLGPSSTWTYLVDDQPFGANPLRDFVGQAGVAGSVIVAPLLALWTLVLHWKRRRGPRSPT